MLIGPIRILSETVPGMPDQGCHLQMENDGRRVEFPSIVASVPFGNRGDTR
jgi:hypothetical protein